jgi:hypothetical protein
MQPRVRVEQRAIPNECAGNRRCGHSLHQPPGLRACPAQSAVRGPRIAEAACPAHRAGANGRPISALQSPRLREVSRLHRTRTPENRVRTPLQGSGSVWRTGRRRQGNGRMSFRMTIAVAARYSVGTNCATSSRAFYVGKWGSLKAFFRQEQAIYGVVLGPHAYHTSQLPWIPDQSWPRTLGGVDLSRVTSAVVVLPMATCLSGSRIEEPSSGSSGLAAGAEARD